MKYLNLHAIHTQLDISTNKEYLSTIQNCAKKALVPNQRIDSLNLYIND